MGGVYPTTWPVLMRYGPQLEETIDMLVEALNRHTPSTFTVEKEEWLAPNEIGVLRIKEANQPGYTLLLSATHKQTFWGYEYYEVVLVEQISENRHLRSIEEIDQQRRALYVGLGTL